MNLTARVLGAACVLFAAGTIFGPAPAGAQGGTVTLQAPDNVRVIAKMNDDRRSFTNYMFWEDVPKEIGTFIHQPDTTGWHARSSRVPHDSLSVPTSGGVYVGSIDRTFTIANPSGSPPGRVGVGSPGHPALRLTVIVDGGRETLNGEMDIGRGYTPGTPIGCTVHGIDLGFKLIFSPGIVDSTAQMRLGLEDFEGYHMFRGTTEDGSDLVNIGEVSKEEAFLAIPIDSIYFNELIPALRASGVYTIPGGGTIDIRSVHPQGKLGANELMWLDSNAFPGFNYRYLVTTYDRGYNVSSTTQGLKKFDSCRVTEAIPCPCPSELVSVSTELAPQKDLPQIYAVPNPYRSGSSQFTTENYHNFPDNKLRFYNVPDWCILKVYTPAGDLVWEFSQQSGTGTIEWDTKNLNGTEVASGVYLYRLESQSGNWMYGRIIIIR